MFFAMRSPHAQFRIVAVASVTMAMIAVTPMISAAFSHGLADLRAQAAPLKSELTGITLPEGYRPNKGLMSRMAGRSLVEMTAKRFGQTVKDLEIFEFKKPPFTGPDSLIAAVKLQGWNMLFEKPHDENERIAWISRGEKPDAKYLMYIAWYKDVTTVYLTTSAGAVVAQAKPPAPTTQPAAPAAGGGAPAQQSPRVAPSAPSGAPATAPASTTNNAPITHPRSWTYTRTTFNDGWTAEDEPNWVRGTKGPITVLVHHTLPETKDFINQDGEAYVWNTIVAPRYRDITNLWVRKPFWDDYTMKFVSAEATEIATGKRYYVAMVQRAYGARFLEFQAPDKATFERELTTVLPGSGTNWKPLLIDGLNRFSVAAADLPGVWNSSSSAGVQYVNVYTGNSAGMGAVSNVEKFTFRNDGSYSSSWRGAGGMVGNQTFAGTDYNGRVIMNSPWQMSLTNRFKGQTEVYDVWFEAVAGGRILVLRKNSYDTRLVREP